MREVIERVASALLDRLGRRWKRVVGLLAMAAITGLFAMNKLTTEQYAAWFGAATTVFGVGVYHRTIDD